jgi:prepilin-type N-terminal cleavage/methylation domain-containing protein
MTLPPLPNWHLQLSLGLKMSQATIAGLTAPSQHKPKSDGFTLVELSIVLVIIGLIVGGIVGGQSLIQSAKSQTLIKELSTIQTGWNTFQLQYDALPGDFSEATDYWPTATYSWIENGDGNGRLQYTDEGAPANEAIESFEHMIISEILPGYKGALTSGFGATNIYGSKGHDGSHYRIHYNINSGKHTIELSAKIDNLQISLFTPKTMYEMDKKLDDGKPWSGKFLAINGSETDAPTCADNASTYNLDETRAACHYKFAVD